MESVQADELVQALLDAEAQSIVGDEARVYTGRPKTQVARASQRQLEFCDRLRVEVLVPEQAVTAALEALDRFSTGPEGRFVQVAEPAPTMGSPGSPSAGGGYTPVQRTAPLASWAEWRFVLPLTIRTLR